MAVLTGITNIGRRAVVGDEVWVTVRTSALGTAAANEWIAAADLGLSWITKIVGFAVIGATTSTVAPSFTKNAQGTGVAEGTNAGDLGVESTDAGINVLEITVAGRV